MKLVISIMVLVVFIIGSATVFYFYSATIHEELHDIIEKIEEAALEDDWEKVNRKNDSLQELWSKGDALWTPVIDHKEVDRVDEAITRIDALSYLCLRDELLVEVVTARRLISRLQDNEKPTLQSIF